MLLPIRWLNEYVDVSDISIRELSDQLTLTGSHVDSIISYDQSIKNVVVGCIEEMTKHPDANNLNVCQLNVGTHRVQIITAATNICQGDYVPVALEGAVLSGEKRIGATDLRGMISQGMLCSYDELGVEDKLIPKESKNGILVFPTPLPLGMNIIEALALDEVILDIEVTFNRPDCLSIIGLARETAATFNRALTLPEVIIKNPVDDIKDYLTSVEIESPDLCSRYYAKVIKDVKIGPSPLWLQRKIMDAGMRPVNNIVDATNYVMLEMGQPLHAFDLEKLKGKKIVVRGAKENEQVMTLDKEVRALSPDICVIADEWDAQCIGGIMGGFDSEVTESTKVIMMESAKFNSKAIRMASKKLGLRSEASSRNEKALSSELIPLANERVCQIIESIGAGKIVKGFYDEGLKNWQPYTVTLRPERANALLGIEIPVHQMVQILNDLEISSVYEEGVIRSQIPHFRADIEQEADLIEEVGRIYGFDKIQPKALNGDLMKGSRSSIRDLEEDIKTYLSSVSFSEITTYSFISPKKYDMLQMPKESIDDIRILNPLGEDFSSMRATMMANMMEVISKNIHYGTKTGRLYEIGHVFSKNKVLSEQPKETVTLSIGMYGDCDFFSIKGIVENIFELMRCPISFIPIENHPSYHPGRCARVVIHDDWVGVIGELHPDVTDAYDIKERAYGAEINLEVLHQHIGNTPKYQSIPKYPAISRDLAVVLDENILVGEILDFINKKTYHLLEKVTFFDCYTGEGIAKGQKSLAFSFVFRSNKKTLNDEEVNEVFSSIVDDLKAEFKALLR